MNTERFKELCSLYFIGGLDETETVELKNALKTNNKDFNKIYNDYKKLALHLPLGVKSVQPPARVKKELFEKINPDQSEQKTGFFEDLTSWLGFNNQKFAFSVMIVLLAAVGILTFYSLHNRSVIDLQQNQIVKLESKLEQNEAVLKVLSAKNIGIVVMQGQDVSPAGYGKIIWDESNKTAILQVSDLPPTPKDKDYQLWIIKDNKPISNGVFAIDSTKERSFFKVTDLVESNQDQINAFAVTLEPKGGVPQPTGKMYLLGTPQVKL